MAVSSVSDQPVDLAYSVLQFLGPSRLSLVIHEAIRLLPRFDGGTPQNIMRVIKL